MKRQWETHPQTLELLRLLVIHDLSKWGCLLELPTAQAVSDRLLQYPCVKLTDLSTALTDTYHNLDLGIGCPIRIGTTALTIAVESGLLSAQTVIYLKYRHGNLMAVIKPEDLPESLTMSREVYFTVDRKRQVLVGCHVGAYHFHHQLYDYWHLDGKTSTLQKILASKRFTSVYIATSDPETDIWEIPY